MQNRNDNTGNLVVERPTWMDQETWSRIKADSTALIDRLVIKLQTADCPYPWCTVTDPAEHQEVHSSDLIELPVPEGDGGWWCWLADDLASDEPQLRLESRGGDGEPVVRVDIDAPVAARLLQASAHPRARAALEELLAVATGWGR